MTDRELLGVMSAILATTIKPRSESRSLFSEKVKEEDEPNDSETIVDAALELLDEATDRCDKKGRLLPED
jgi:hypothetical protein